MRTQCGQGWRRLGRRGRACPRDGQRGSVTIELAILAPSLMLVACFAMLVGRTSFAYAAVDAAAYSAARAASLARDPQTAQQRAEDSAQTTLDSQGLRCLDREITIDPSGFGKEVGEPASVTVTIRCRVSLAAAAMPGMPTYRWVSAQYSSPLDLFRSRNG